MTTINPQPPDKADGFSGPDPDPTSKPLDAPVRITRASAAWVAIGAALVMLTLLIVFVLQNQTKVDIRFLGLNITIPLGMAMLIAAVIGGVIVLISGIARIMQLRRDVRRSNRRSGFSAD